MDQLRHVGETTGSQLTVSQDRAEQLKDHVADLERQLKAAQVKSLKQDAAISDLLSQHKSSNQKWQQERQQLQEGSTQWRQQAVQLQQEVRYIDDANGISSYILSHS